MVEFELKPYAAEYYSQVKNIFWLTSSRLPPIEERDDFQNKYLDVYLTHLCFVAVESGKVLGYILCQPDPLKTPAPLELFNSFIADYPAHLHINAHPEAQGRGVGAALLAHLEKVLCERGIKGVHLVTHADVRNRFFYEKNDYIPLHETSHKLLLLGKKLRAKNL